MVVKQLHLKFSILRRSKDESSVASAAYAAGEKLIDVRTGQAHDNSSKRGVVHSEITLPDGPMPSWARDRNELWNEVERVQRKNGQPARKCVLSLPHQLTDEARERIVRQWVQALCNRYGCVCDWSLHRPDPDGDPRNEHGHAQFSTNVIDENGFQGKVCRNDWDNIAAKRKGAEPEAIRWARELFCRLVNQELEAAGIDERWDHRALTVQRDEALRLADDAMREADAARQRGDEPGAAAWRRKAEEYARHADECDREPTKKAGQASINRERQRYRLERTEATRLQAEARQAAIAARDAGEVSLAEELERKAQAHADRAREIESHSTSELIKRDVDRYADTPPNGSDRVEVCVRAPIRRNAELRRARTPVEILAVSAATLQVPPATPEIALKEVPVIADAVVPVPAPVPHGKHARKRRPTVAVTMKPRAPLQSIVRAWSATPQGIQASKSRLLEKEYESALSRELAPYLKYAKARKGQQLARLHLQHGIAGGDPWLSITLNDGGRIYDNGDTLLVKEQTRVAMIAMVAIAGAKGWNRVELLGERSFRRDAWLEYQLNGIETHGYEPNDDDVRELGRLRSAREFVGDAIAEDRVAPKHESDQYGWYTAYQDGPTPRG